MLSVKKGVGVPHPFSVLERKRATVRPLIDSYYGVVLRGQSFLSGFFSVGKRHQRWGLPINAVHRDGGMLN